MVLYSRPQSGAPIGPIPLSDISHRSYQRTIRTIDVFVVLMRNHNDKPSYISVSFDIVFLCFFLSLRIVSGNCESRCLGLFFCLCLQLRSSENRTSFVSPLDYCPNTTRGGARADLRPLCPEAPVPGKPPDLSRHLLLVDAHRDVASRPTATTKHLFFMSAQGEKVLRKLPIFFSSVASCRIFYSNFYVHHKITFCSLMDYFYYYYLQPNPHLRIQT